MLRLLQPPPPPAFVFSSIDVVSVSSIDVVSVSSIDASSASSSVVPPPPSPASMSPSLAEASDISDEKPCKTGSKPPEPLKDYIHVRARRGQTTDSHSLAEDRRHLQTSQLNTRPPALLLQSEPFIDICFFDTCYSSMDASIEAKARMVADKRFVFCSVWQKVVDKKPYPRCYKGFPVRLRFLTQLAVFKFFGGREFDSKYTLPELLSESKVWINPCNNNEVEEAAMVREKLSEFGILEEHQSAIIQRIFKAVQVATALPQPLMGIDVAIRDVKVLISGSTADLDDYVDWVITDSFKKIVDRGRRCCNRMSECPICMEDDIFLHLDDENKLVTSFALLTLFSRTLHCQVAGN
ncbi:uncharacterized protein LOC133712946 [Rosa rugosa]|uniref:uncharacterized protein LOC133712946 n=1 Tax=Rosa rugosa TaxID=74645 RepID=UPI002B40A758|nr:uncharacterized protein LOC133712946 [Rosa rugosa]